MGKYILNRLLYSLVTIIGISIIVFSVIHLIPGDPIAVMFGLNPDPEAMEIARRHYQLDKPIVTQYFIWVGNLFKGDLGNSIITGEPVANLVLLRTIRTLGLTIVGVLFSITLAIPIGMISAWKHNTWTDFSLTTLSLVLISIPEFWIGVVFMMIFAVWLGILPSSGYVSPMVSFLGWMKIIILPALTVAAVQSAQTARMVRANMIEILSLDYIRLMKALGIRNSRILIVHAFRNVLVPVLTQIGMQIGYLMGGVIIIERVFTFPGLGHIMVKALEERDYPVVQASILVYAIIFVLINFVIDLIYGFINPKIKYQDKV